jgi:hypothetical protein
MKKLVATLAACATTLVATAAFASMTIRYENKDSQTYKAEAICSGSKQDPVEFKASTTSSVTIQGSTPCKVTLGGQTHEFKSDVKVIIKDGKIQIQ